MITFAIAWAVAISPVAQTERATLPPRVALGAVNGNNVYVRSGPSTTYYPVLKLDQGTEVQIVDQRPGWIGIVPPTGTYSLVQRDKVDLQNQGKTGVINDDRVRVYAGSTLSPQRYAKQVLLNRGATVKMMGEQDAAQYYKVQPPAGAQLWISADYVQMSPATEKPVPQPRVTTPPETAPAATAPAASAATPPTADAATATPEAATPEPDPAPTPTTTEATNRLERTMETAQIAPLAVEVPVISEDPDTQARIVTLEQQIAHEATRDVFARDYTTIIAAYRPLSEQTADVRAQRYATYRIQQLDQYMQRAQALQRLDRLRTEVREIRESYSGERARPRATPQITQSYDVMGKLVESFAFNRPGTPRRYRIVSSQEGADRTIAYVEIEPGSGIDPQRFLGRHVGVRSKAKRLLRGAVDPTTVHVPAEIVVLETGAAHRAPE